LSVLASGFRQGGRRPRFLLQQLLMAVPPLGETTTTGCFTSGSPSEIILNR
jgi:hypothetical protein